MKILYAAEIVGKAGVYAFKKGLAALRKEGPVDFVIANADGATGGNGLGRNHAGYIRKLGAQCITTGECCFYKKDLTENLEKIPYVLRPANLNSEAPGAGSRVFRFKAGGRELKIGAALLLGQSGFVRMHGDNPYSRLPGIIERLKAETPFVFIDFHAGATAEKQTLFSMAAGLCTAVVGSHSRVQTADERILHGTGGSPGTSGSFGTAVITDAGRCGSAESVGGVAREQRITEYLTGIPDWTKESWESCEFQGVLIDADDRGRALSIRRIKMPVEPPPEAAAGALEEEGE